MGRRKRQDPTVQGGFIAYFRVSTTKQGESGLGLEAQRDSVRRYVVGRSGQILQEFTEIESGKKNDRPQLTAALAACKKHGATLTVAKLDRLSRSLAFISALMESGVEFAVADMPSANKLTLHILAVVAENEREAISARTKAGLAMVQRELAEVGFRVSKKSGRKFTKLGNPNAKAALVKARASRKFMRTPERILGLLQTLRTQGKSYRAIAEHMNELGIKTATGAQWYAAQVRMELNKAELPVAA